MYTGNIGLAYRTAIGLIVAGLTLTGAVQASPINGWIEHAPSKEQVLKDIQGTDNIDTPARQMAAFEILRNAIETWTGELDWRRMTPKAADKYTEYIRGIREAPYGLQFDDRKCSGSSCIRWRFYHKEWHYSLDSDFTRAMLEHYFGPQYAESVIEARKGDKPRFLHGNTFPTTVQLPTTDHNTTWDWDIILWVGGGALLLLVWLGTRKQSVESNTVENKNRSYYTPSYLSENTEVKNSFDIFGQKDNHSEPPSAFNSNSIWDGYQWVNKAGMNEPGSVWHPKLGAWVRADQPIYYKDPDD